MFAMFCFSSRDEPDTALPPPVYRALIESLFKGAAANSANVLAYILLAVYQCRRAADQHVVAASILIVVAGFVRIFVERGQHRLFLEHDGRGLATVASIRRSELRYLAVMAAFALALGSLQFFVLMDDDIGADRLMTLSACVAFLVSSPARCSGSPRIVAVQAWLIVLPFAAAMIVIGGAGSYLGLALAALILRHMRAMTKTLHGTQVSMLLARRGAEDVADKFDTALNNMTSGLVMIDRQSRIQVANWQFADIFGLSAPPVDLHVWRLIDRFIAPLIEQDEAAAMVRGFFDGDGDDNCELRLADGRILALSRQPMPQGAVVTVADVTAEHAAEEYVRRMARYDPVCGLPNRANFAEKLATALASDRENAHFCLLSIDLDRFKEVNDSHGHQVGDQLLAMAGERLRAAAEPGFVARFGGDEFSVLLPTANLKRIEEIGAAIIRALSQPFEIDARIVRIGASVGAAIYPDDAADDAPESLIKAADMALYGAKAAGRGAMKFFAEEMAHAVRRRRQLGEELRKAVARGEMSLVYQPIVDIADESVTAVEALLRWTHPEFGAVGPGEFVPVAEENATIVEIGDFVLRQACRDALSWPDSVRVAVNLSALQFERGDLVATVTAALAESGLPAYRLELEITETILICNHETVLTTLNRLHGLGVHVALDDFGTGYSSLSYLNDFAFDKVKVDQSFVRAIGAPDNAKAASIIRAVNAIGRDLRMGVVVEGIETQDQLSAIQALGVRGAQGYFFSRPVPAADIGVYLLKRMAERARRAGAPRHRAEAG